MITVVQLAVEVNAPTERAEANLSHLNQSAEKSGSALGKLGGFARDAASALTGFLGSQALLGGIGGVGGLVSYIFGSDMQLENTTTAFTRLLGSASAAQDEIANLQKFAADTPLEFPDVAQATQALLGYGFQLKQTQPLITAIGDALAATGHLDPATLQQVVTVFGQMHAGLSLHTQDLQQLQSVGINAFKLLADNIKPTKKQIDDLIRSGLIPAGKAHDYLSGKVKLTTADITQLVTDGLIPSQDGIDALTTGIEKNPIYKGGMGDQAKTTAGKISTLKDNLTQAAQTMSKPIFDEFSHLIDKAGAAVSSKAFKDFAKTVGQDVAGALKTGIETTKNIVGWFIQWHEPILIVSGVLTAFFIPAMIKSGLESVINGGKIAVNFVANLIKSGVEGYQAAGKIAIWIGKTIASGVEAVIAGGKIAASWIANVITGGSVAAASAVEVDALAASETAAGTSAVTAAPELDALATAEAGVGTAATTAAGSGTVATAAGGAGAGFGIGVGGFVAGLFSTVFAGQAATDAISSLIDKMTGMHHESHNFISDVQNVWTWLTNLGQKADDAKGSVFNLEQIMQDFKNAPPPEGFWRDVFGNLLDLRNYADEAARSLHNMWMAYYSNYTQGPFNPKNPPMPGAPPPTSGKPRASGGPVFAGGAYTINEAGREMLIMGNRDGYILDHQKTEQVLSQPAGGDTYNFNGITSPRELQRTLTFLGQRKAALYGR